MYVKIVHKMASSDFERFLGLELSGPKNERSSLAALDYSRATQRLILTDVETSFGGVEDVSADEVLLEHVKKLAAEPGRQFKGLTINAPLTLPPLFAQDTRSSLLREVVWMKKIWSRIKPRPRPFEPYLQRPVEIYLKYMTQEKFLASDALGSNLAPLTARAHYLQKKLPKPIFESVPRFALQRIVIALGLSKNLYRDYTDVDKGLATREALLTGLLKKVPQLFIYDRDFEHMVQHPSQLNAFVLCLCGYLNGRGLCEKAPKSFPRSAGWTLLPKKTWPTTSATIRTNL
jgi:hypothetical protein